MPEAMLPVSVLVVCPERGRSERACERGEHGVNYVGDRGQLIIIRFSDQKLREFHAVAETIGQASVAWVMIGRQSCGCADSCYPVLGSGKPRLL